MIRLYLAYGLWMWHSQQVLNLALQLAHPAMNLVVASRHNGVHMRFDVEGRWTNGDALKLAYMVKAAVARLRQDHVLIDLRRVNSAPEADGKFLICDRLRRALTPKTKVVLVGAAELVDDDVGTTASSQCADIALFGAEPDALNWLSQH